MYTIAQLADGTHFRFHDRDQHDREQVWGLIPRPPVGFTEI